MVQNTWVAISFLSIFCTFFSLNFFSKIDANTIVPGLYYCVLKDTTWTKTFVQFRGKINRSKKPIACAPGFSKVPIIGCHRNCDSGYSVNPIAPWSCFFTKWFNILAGLVRNCIPKIGQQFDLIKWEFFLNWDLCLWQQWKGRYREPRQILSDLSLIDT